MKIAYINSTQSVSKYRGTENKDKTSQCFFNKDNQINELSNVCYKPISFGRTTAEHKSWGGQIDPETKEVSFKLFTYPDSKKAYVTVIKRNDKMNKKSYELENKGNGIFESKEKLSSDKAASGDYYYYTIYKGNGDIDRVKDPYSYRQEKLTGISTLYDHSLFEWSDDSWYNGNKSRISRKANSKNQLTSLNEASIYELNISSFTKKGSFDAAKNKLKKIKSEGFNTIEIMPAENTYSFNWGYDGVDKMAPSEHLGGPDGLKTLVNEAHNQGLNVIMDMVPNHIGPDGSELLQAGPYTGGSNCFGDSFNYEGENSRYVRDFIVNAAMNWVKNYHCDGLRLDMTKFMNSDYTLKQIVSELNYHSPDTFIIAEDSREHVNVNNNGDFYDDYNEPHDKRVTNPLKTYETGEGESEDIHCNAIEKISNGETSLGRLGCDSEWDFNYFHTLKDEIYGGIDLDSFEKACYCSQNRVKYVMSHDEIGNFEGSRLIPKLMTPMLHLEDNILLNEEDLKRSKEYSDLKHCPQEEALNVIRAQKAQFTAEELAIMLQTGELDKYDTSKITSKHWINAVEQSFKNDVLKKLDIKTDSGINLDMIKTMYNRSFSRNKMALARTCSIPGAKMVFQGDENADLTPFRFFREFKSNKDEGNLYIEKGYNTGKSALRESTLGNIKYSQNGRNTMRKFLNLTKDLNKLNKENPALTKGYLDKSETVKHHGSNVFATLTKDNKSNNEIYTITNFNAAGYPRSDAADYYIKFPQGEWTEILNTDDKKYGGSGIHNNKQNIISDGKTNSPIKLAGESTILFKKIK